MRIQTLLLLFCLVLPQLSSAAGPPKSQDSPQGVSSINPGADLWREVRQRDGAILEGISQVKSVDSGFLINARGDEWARFRITKLSTYGGIAIAAIFVIVTLLYVVRGKIPIDGGLSGRMVRRFTDYERIVHWTLAIVFLFLAITGLILLLGKPLLLPILGKEVFSLFASASKEGHNLFGPLFILGIFALFIRFVSKNFLARGDIGWIFKGGGFFGGKHPTAGFFNMGEKIWFWAVIMIGLLISATGLILEFPFFGQTRTIMALSLVLHGVGAVLLIGGAFGHIYVGTAGMKGSINSMTTGYVDLNWARQHHDRWAADCEAKGEVLSESEFARSQGQSTLGEVPEPVIKGES